MIENIEHYRKRYFRYLDDFPKSDHKTIIGKLVRLEITIENQENKIRKYIMSETFRKYVFSGIVLNYDNSIYNVDDIRFIIDEEVKRRFASLRTLN